ncbi:nuclear transport factor 2 family protein [Nocardia sp. NPDC004860]|uniref:nuclear transport factor 2 family protein n=1 Tax=Nocardia sp. NPDC004860 TaxID=3154557 RepID=UPI0033A61F67
MTAIPDDLLATIAAERAIFQTFFRFFRIADSGECERFNECFTPDAVIEYRIMPGPVTRFEGRDAFTAYMTQVPEDKRSPVAHVIGQTHIDWTGGQPLLTAYATVWHWSSPAAYSDYDRPADWTVIGLIRDRFEKFDGEWLISHRDVRPVSGRTAAGAVPH